METKLKELGFVLCDTKFDYQRELNIPTYYNKKHDMILMQYDMESGQDLRCVGSWLLIKKYCGSEQHTRMTSELLMDIDNDILMNEIAR